MTVLTALQVAGALAPITHKIVAALNGGRKITKAEWLEILGGDAGDEALDKVNELRRKARGKGRRGQ